MKNYKLKKPDIFAIWLLVVGFIVLLSLAVAADKTEAAYYNNWVIVMSGVAVLIGCHIKDKLKL